MILFSEFFIKNSNNVTNNIHHPGKYFELTNLTNINFIILLFIFCYLFCLTCYCIIFLLFIFLISYGLNFFS